MGLAILTFLTGVSISVIAIYYSVLGLAAIFAAAVIPIVVMGTVLEVSKLVTAWWLKANWHRAPWAIKSYLTIAVLVLMLITSMGIFGFLSKAHSDQAVPTGDVVAAISLIDDKIAIARENIQTQRDNIAAARSALSQLDAQTTARLDRSTDEAGAERAVQIRRNQARERGQLQSEITKAQTEIERLNSVIAQLNEEKAPVARELRKVEAEVGPIKYIAALIYGDNPDQNLLEKAVVWVIITIVFVFDPLAVLLLLASQMSFQWARQEREQNEPKQVMVKESANDDYDNSVKEFFDRDKELFRSTDQNNSGLSNDDLAAMNIKPPKEEDIRPFSQKEIAALDQPTENIETEEPKTLDAPEEYKEPDDEEIIASAPKNEKEAMHVWKSLNPNDSLKHQRKLFEKGMIDHLPWEDYLKAQPDFEEQGYIQNSEQNSSTIWQRIKTSKKDS